MEEASSIAKAIENAWARAGQPQEFSIKVLEYPRTSFFGLKTAKSAKIAFFFTEVAQKAKELPKQRPITPRSPQVRETASREQEQPKATTSGRTERPERSSTPAPRHDQRRAAPHRPERQERHPSQHSPRYEQRSEPQRPVSDQKERSFEPRENWTPELVEIAKDWLKETLNLFGKSDIVITSYVNQNYLKLALSHSVSSDSRQEETQLKSWGNLAMEALREKTNKPLRNLRIILESKRHDNY